MIYLDKGGTSFRKPPAVGRAMVNALQTCANSGRGGYPPSMRASEVVLECREQAAVMFDCQPEQVGMTVNCTHGLNIALQSLIPAGDRVLITGFEHNAVTRPLHALGAKPVVAGRKLFDWEDTLSGFEDALRSGVRAAVFTHVSNVFGYILPVEQMAALCRKYNVPFVIDAAQSAGVLPVRLKAWGASYIAMPGHKGLLGPQGTGLLLCNQMPKPLLYGGTGSLSRQQQMPGFLPDSAEAGTLNVVGIAGLQAGLSYLQRTGIEKIFAREQAQAQVCARGLEKMGFRVLCGDHQAGTVSFVPETDCEEAARQLAERGICVRAGLHCAPLAHESAGTLETGTVRVSFGHDATPGQTGSLLRAAGFLAR